MSIFKLFVIHLSEARSNFTLAGLFTNKCQQFIEAFRKCSETQMVKFPFFVLISQRNITISTADFLLLPFKILCSNALYLNEGNQILRNMMKMITSHVQSITLIYFFITWYIFYLHVICQISTYLLSCRCLKCLKLVFFLHLVKLI